MNFLYAKNLIEEIVKEINGGFSIMNIERCFVDIQHLELNVEEKQKLCYQMLEQIEKSFSLNNFCINCINCPFLFDVCDVNSCKCFAPIENATFVLEELYNKYVEVINIMSKTLNISNNINSVLNERKKTVERWIKNEVN